MKLKKKVRVFIIILLVLLLALLSFLVYQELSSKEATKEVKVINEIKEYGYKLKENKPAKYKKMFEELKEILDKEEVDEEIYAKKISEMFIYDFYSLNDKTAKTDVGGVDFIYSEILENFLDNAQNTYYKYVESNIYNNRKQKLPIVDEIAIDGVEKKEFKYSDKTDNEAYYANVTWTYVDNEFESYQKEAKLVFIHEDKKLSLVELQ